jgi:hypothetical protein
METEREEASTEPPFVIVSGGQTGVDRAALDAAIELGIPHDGWCPLGRRAEDGRLPERYLLRETDSPRYDVRTRQNVLDSDATLVLFRGTLSGGTELTYRLALREGKVCLAVDLGSSIEATPDPASTRDWIVRHRVRRLNVAGSRESQRRGIYALAKAYLTKLFGADERRT